MLRGGERGEGRGERGEEKVHTSSCFPFVILADKASLIVGQSAGLK